MKIYDLKDLKTALSKIPDKVCETLAFFIAEDGNLRIGCSEGEDEGEMSEKFIEQIKEYPEITDIDSLVRNMQKTLEDEGSGGEPIDNIRG